MHAATTADVEQHDSIGTTRLDRNVPSLTNAGRVLPAKLSHDPDTSLVHSPVCTWVPSPVMIWVLIAIKNA